VVVVVALAAGACGDNAAVVVPTVSGQGARPAASGSGPALPSTYSGLGARRAVFAASHRESPRGRGPGVPLVTAVASDPAGRVTGYQIQWNDRPPLSDYERLVSAAGLNDVPRDRITVSQATSCLIYGSPSLKQLIGVSYVRVTTTPGTATASVQGAAKPTC
jgi:hypothetical protein